jgi:hemolysin III
MDRVVLGRMQNPVRGFLHGSAAVVSVAGMVALLTRSDRAGTTVAIAVYGLALIVMYVTSAMYHSIPWQPGWKRRFQQLDHTFIYVLVAASFSALAVSVGGGPWMVLGLAGIWSLVALGLVKELIQGPGRRVVFPLQIVAVAIALPALWLTLVGMDTPAATLTLVGGTCYLLGVYLFVNDRPRLAPRVFSHHEFFHVVVIVSSLLHYLAVWRVVPMV